MWVALGSNTYIVNIYWSVFIAGRMSDGGGFGDDEWIPWGFSCGSSYIVAGLWLALVALASWAMLSCSVRRRSEQKARWRTLW